MFRPLRPFKTENKTIEVLSCYPFKRIILQDRTNKIDFEIHDTIILIPFFCWKVVLKKMEVTKAINPSLYFTEAVT